MFSTIHWLSDVVRARRPRRLPIVLTGADVRRILAELKGRRPVVHEHLIAVRRIHEADLEAGLGELGAGARRVLWRPYEEKERPGTGQVITDRPNRLSSIVQTRQDDAELHDRTTSGAL
ncbi:MAG: hypothetical protein ACXW2F_07660 [Thermoanaerobaculia bacterium]